MGQEARRIPERHGQKAGRDRGWKDTGQKMSGEPGTHGQKDRRGRGWKDTREKMSGEQRAHGQRDGIGRRAEQYEGQDRERGKRSRKPGSRAAEWHQDSRSHPVFVHPVIRLKILPQ